MNAATPLVGIIIINYNGRADTFECLLSLTQITYPNYRIYLVDNGSADKIGEDVRNRFRGVRVIENERNLGFTGGNNTGIKVALQEGCDYILLLNNDTVVERGFIEPLLARLSDTNVAMSTPKIYIHGFDKKIWAFGGRLDRFLGRSPHIGVDLIDQGQFSQSVRVDRITGCAMFIKSDIIRRFGMLDDQFFIYDEEADWCIRLSKKGYRFIVEPSSLIWHKGHRDSGRIGRPFMVYLQARNHLLLLRKHSNFYLFGGSVALIYSLLSAIRTIFASYFGLFLRRDKRYLGIGRAVFLGILDGIRGRFGKPIYF